MMAFIQHPAIGVLLTAILYCGVNAIVLGYLLNRYSKINRFGLFFNQALLDSALSILIIIGSQAFFLIYFCRIQYFGRLIFGAAADRCQIPDLATMVLHSALPLMAVITLIAITIQFFFIRAQYTYLNDERLMLYLSISNIVAMFAKYGLIITLYC